MIQTRMRNDRGDWVDLVPGDPDYWKGPYHMEPYPMTLFKAELGREQCQKTVVKSDRERERLGSQWQESPVEAKEVLEKMEREMAAAAAEHNAAVSKMSIKAQAEALAHDRSTDEMVTDVPAPKRGPGRPRNPTTVSTE